MKHPARGDLLRWTGLALQVTALLANVLLNGLARQQPRWALYGSFTLLGLGMLCYGWYFADEAMLARRRRRIRKGLCPVCAYDLRASRVCCPECGTPLPAGLQVPGIRSL